MPYIRSGLSFSSSEIISLIVTNTYTTQKLTFKLIMLLLRYEIKISRKITATVSLRVKLYLPVKYEQVCTLQLALHSAYLIVLMKLQSGAYLSLIKKGNSRNSPPSYLGSERDYVSAVDTDCRALDTPLWEIVIVAQQPLLKTKKPFN